MAKVCRDRSEESERWWPVGELAYAFKASKQRQRQQRVGECKESLVKEENLGLNPKQQ